MVINLQMKISCLKHDYIPKMKISCLKQGYKHTNENQLFRTWS